jgi:hypothetical protein
MESDSSAEEWSEDEWTDPGNNDDDQARRANPRINKTAQLLESLLTQHTARALVGILGLKLTGT